MAAVVEKFLLGSQTSLITTGFNSLANNSLAISPAFDNTIGQTGDGYTLCDLELVVTFGTNPTANTGVSIWFLSTQDGTNYEDGGTSTTPARAPDCVIPVAVSTSAQRIIVRTLLPWGLLKALAKNDGTGQAFASSGNTLKIRPVTREAV